MNEWELTSIASVAFVTMALMSALVKPAMARVAYLRKVPVVVYSLAIAVVLTIVANKITGTLSGDSFWLLVYQSIAAVLAAQGIYKLPSATQPVEKTQLPDQNINLRGEVFIRLLPLLMLLGGCAAVPESYLAADRATFNAIAPEYRSYVAADPALTQEQRDRRQRTIDTWQLRVQQGAASTQPAGR